LGKGGAKEETFFTALFFKWRGGGETRFWGKKKFFFFGIFLNGVPIGGFRGVGFFGFLLLGALGPLGAFFFPKKKFSIWKDSGGEEF